MVYSVVDKSSFSKAEQLLIMLQEIDLIRSRCCILVANKIDLARSRAVSTQDGKCMACTYRVKFIEVSVGINHNVDELLAGVLSQIRLKREFSELKVLFSKKTFLKHFVKSLFNNFSREQKKTLETTIGTKIEMLSGQSK